MWKRQRLQDNSGTETFVVWLQVPKGTIEQYIQEVLNKQLTPEFTAVLHPDPDEGIFLESDREGT